MKNLRRIYKKIALKEWLRKRHRGLSGKGAKDVTKIFHVNNYKTIRTSGSIKY